MASFAKERRLLSALTIGLAAGVLFTSLLVVVKETTPSVMQWLKTTFSHHWVGHGVLTLLVFALATIITYTFAKWGIGPQRSLWVVTSVTVVGVLIVLGFFISEL
ncbi:MAG: hypothetical protein HXX80_02145 [Nitrososphaerales archaeon]|nr:hypothetical protein [Nitrososphaerales archaeon]